MKRTIHTIKLMPLDKLFSEYIRKRAKGRCEVCGKPAKLQTSHFIGRRNRQTRWEENNCLAVCFSCHQYFHENPHEHTAFMQNRLGDRYDILMAQAQQIQKPDYEGLKLYLEDLLSKL